MPSSVIKKGDKAIASEQVLIPDFSFSSINIALQVGMNLYCISGLTSPSFF